MKRFDYEQYIASVGNEHRKRSAQYFTPLPIARFMLNWLVQDKRDIDVFDPAFGLGAFLRIVLMEFALAVWILMSRC